MTFPNASPEHNLLADQTRRSFLTSSASGIGAAALASLLSDEGLLASAEGADGQDAFDPLAPRASHHNGPAKSCIFIFMAGAPSHLDLFDPKPKLNELHGKPLPESILKDVRFAFIKKESATLLGTKRTFTKHGESGMEFSEFLPNIATCADDLLMIRSLHSEQFNHHPGQLLMQCGRATFGLPTMGSWLSYGLCPATSY